MRTSEQQQIDNRAAGWAWVARELARVRLAARAEAERLLGPDRGE